MSVGSVSTSTTSQILQSTVQRLQNQLNTASSESSTGLLANIGLTLGATSAQDINMHQQMASLAAITASNNVVTAQLSTASDALTSLQSTTESMLSQIVTAESQSPGTTGADALQQTAAGALATFSTTMNASVGGVYVFGGVNSGAAPISTSAGQTAAQTAFNTYLTSIPATASTITGAQMTSFLNGPYAALFSGSNWTSNWSSASDTVASNQIGVNETTATSISANQSAFQGTAQALTMLSAFGGLGLSSDAYSALMTNAQSTMNTANNALIEANAAVGTMQNQVTDANSSISLQTNVLSTQINSVESVNGYDVATQVSNLSTQLQTAYELTAQIAKLSLVNYIS